MNKILAGLILILLVPGENTWAQNLVLNPSFEDTVACPTGLNQISSSLGWNSYRETPDYFNSCTFNPQVSIPYNSYGYQYPATAYGMAGFQAYFTTNFREIIGGQLADSLTIGSTYYLSIKFNRAHGGGVQANCACNGLGIKFTTQPYNINNPIAIDNFAHVFTNLILEDTLNWTQVSGTFIADSNYSHFAIGNFFDDLNTDTIQSSTNPCRAIYFVDDVCVSSDSLLCEFWSNNNVIRKELFNIYPNPAAQFINIIGSDFTEIYLYNLLGSVIYSKSFMASQNSIQLDLSDFANGIYNIKLISQEKITVKKIVVYH